MERMIADYGSCKEAKDYSRVLRLAGFFHRKREPFMVGIVEQEGLQYSTDQIIEAFPRLSGRHTIKN